MYSIVMLTAMTTTTEAPAFGDIWAKKCFWDACWPARYGWVPCGGGQPYYPASYASCCGWGGHHFKHHHGCYSACYGCAGWGCGCAGWGHGCWSPSYHCYGGGIAYSGIGYAGFGAYGNYGMYGTVPYVGAPALTPPIVTIHPVNAAQIVDPKPIQIKPQVDSGSNNTASILVKVPANAKVFIDDYLMKSTSSERLFTSPELEPGRSYYYTIRVVIEKDGKPQEESRRVQIRAGETSWLAFDALDKPRDDGRALAESKP